MSVRWQDYSLSELKQHAIQTFRQGGGSRPDVLLIEIHGEHAVLKDQAAADPLFASLIGPLLNWRECKALRRLHAVDCIPQLLAVPTARSFLMSYHPSQQLNRVDISNLDTSLFFEALHAAIRDMHAAGVAHNDLRNPSNTLVTPNGEPILVDLVACFCRGQAWNWPNRWLFNKFSQVDKSAITKMKARFAPELLNETDIHAEDIAGQTGMAIKGLGQKIRRLSRLLFTSKK